MKENRARNMNVRSLFCLLLTLCMMLSFCACGKKAAEAEESASEVQEVQDAEKTVTAPAEENTVAESAEPDTEEAEAEEVTDETEETTDEENVETEAEETAEVAEAEAEAEEIVPLTDRAELRAAYQNACRALDTGNYEEAIRLFSMCPNYVKSNRLLLDAKYRYVRDNPDQNNPTTMAYLQDMKDANYGGYQYMYDLIYAWHVEVTAINIDPNSTEHMEMIGKNHEVFVHYKVSGGPPDGKLHMCMTGKLPAYYAGNQYADVVAGDEGVFSFRYTKEPREKGTVSALFHDQKGRLIGMRSTFLSDIPKSGK